MKPVIGITSSAQIDALDHGTYRRYVLSAPYVRAIEKAGGTALIIPPQIDAVASILQVIDGLLLSGGPDIEPSRYGDRDIHPATYGIDPERDQFELALFHTAMTCEMPILGICRGIQIMNVALGGSLFQDVASQHPGAGDVGHRQHERGLEDWQVGHTVAAAAHKLPLFPDGALGVNSFHHQAIRDLSPQLAPVAYSTDGLVEAVAMTGPPAIFAVQWHPELMFEHDDVHLRAFTYLVELAAARRLTLASG